MTPISIVNQQQKLNYDMNNGDLTQTNSYISNRGGSNRRINYHYQQQQQSQQLNAGGVMASNNAYGHVQEYANVRGTNPLLGGSSNDYRKQAMVHQTVIPDIRERKMREREERIKREREELEQLQQQYPFGRQGGGGGAPFRDIDGNVISTRRPYSQVREPTSQLNKSTLNRNLNTANQYQPQTVQPNPYQELNQPIDVGQLHNNYYQQAAQQAQKYQFTNQPTNLPQHQSIPQKITSIETPDQREQRMKRQMEYQEILRQQMEEKKAKEEEIKRKRMEEDLKQEMKIKEQIERERQQEMLEKQKKEQQKNQYNNSDIMGQENFVKVKRGQKVQHSPVQHSSKSQDISIISQGPNDYGENNLKFKLEPTQKPEMNQFDQQYQQHNNRGYGLINSQNFSMFNQMENQFQSELQKLKSEMILQQQQFETQLQQLRSEAQKNIDYRIKAEQELQRFKVNSQSNTQRPSIIGSSASQRDNSNLVRRSMAGMNNYEKLFFGSIQNQNLQRYPTIGLSNVAYHEDSQSQGLGGKFEGSLSLKADSTFLPLQQLPPQPLPNNQIPTTLQNEKINEMKYQKPQQLQTLQGPILDKFEGDPGLNQLHNAIEEISEMNLGENYKETQKVLEEARTKAEHRKEDQQQDEDSQTQRQELISPDKYLKEASDVVPEYQGIQKEDQEMNHLAYQFTQANNRMIDKEKQIENEELKKEYLMRNIPLNPILESSNEQTFPSQGIGSLLDKNKQQNDIKE